MSAKCKWCHRKRPEVTIEVDGREIDVCSNCKGIIQGRSDEESEIERDRRRRHPVAE